MVAVVTSFFFFGCCFWRLLPFPLSLPFLLWLSQAAWSCSSITWWQGAAGAGQVARGER